MSRQSSSETQEFANGGIERYVSPFLSPSCEAQQGWDSRGEGLRCIADERNKRNSGRCDSHDGALANVAVADGPQHLRIRDGDLVLRLPLLKSRAIERKWLLLMAAARVASR